MWLESSSCASQNLVIVGELVNVQGLDHNGIKYFYTQVIANFTYQGWQVSRSQRAWVFWRLMRSLGTFCRQRGCAGSSLSWSLLSWRCTGGRLLPCTLGWFRFLSGLRLSRHRLTRRLDCNFLPLTTSRVHVLLYMRHSY